MKAGIVYMLARIAVLGALLFSPAVLMAQEPGVPGDPEPTRSEAEIQQSMAAAAAFYSQEIAIFSFLDLRIMYFIGNLADDSRVPFATPNAFEDLFFAEIAYSWEDVTGATAERPLDILFIHDSALSEVDTIWARQAYRNGTAIVGISTPFKEFAAVVGDSCVKNENSWIPDYYDEWYVYFVYRATVDPADGRSVVDADTLDNCREKYEGLLGVAVVHGAFIRGISSQESLNRLVATLRSQFVQRKLQGITLPSQSVPLPLPPSPVGN